VLDPAAAHATYVAMARTTSTSARNVSQTPGRQRAAGLRVVTVRVPDLRNPAYRERLAAACDELAALPTVEGEADAAAGLAEAFKHMPGWP
jgi:hypothetical protein